MTRVARTYLSSSGVAYAERLREAVPVLDHVQKNLRKLLTKKAAKKRFKRGPVSASKEGPLLQNAIIGTSVQEDIPQEAAAAGTKTTTSGAAEYYARRGWARTTRASHRHCQAPAKTCNAPPSCAVPQFHGA
jgi:hypothetical protein